jgi:DNA-binding transcriptional ArsR family regulator
MHQEDLDIKVKFLRGFADKTRIQILHCIKEQEKTVTQVVEEIQGNQSNISQHLSCLKGCGIISGRQEGKYIYYGLKNNHVKQLLEQFDEVLSQVHEEVAHCEQNGQCLDEKAGEIQ